MNEILSVERVRAFRMHALGLHAQPEHSASGTQDRVDQVTEVVRRMTAMQGQDWRSAQWAVGVRAPGITRADVAAACTAGTIVRSWPMRGTVHLVPAEDIGWIQQLTGRRVLATAPKRRVYLGITDAVLAQLIEVSLAALREAGARGLSRDSLSQRWSDAGLEWQPNWRYHLIWWLCQNNLATFGPASPSGEPLLVSAEEWITSPRQLSDDDGLRELAQRYTAAHGPVRDRDFAWWTGLTLREARTGLRAANDAGGLVPVRAADSGGAPIDGTDGALWITPELLDAESNAQRSAPEWLLLPAFDEHLLGYTERSPQLSPDQASRIVPGNNGMFLATVVHRGRVVGTWKRAASGARDLVVTPLPGETIDASALEPALVSWSAFHAESSPAIRVE